MDAAEGRRIHGRALWDFFRGDRSASLVLHSDLGEHDEIPVSVFFREPPNFFPFDKAALELCRGRVLDVGAGTGVHSLVLQARGFSVCAIDILPQAIDIMQKRGVRQAYLADAFGLAAATFDTVLMLMNGIGIVGDLDGLDRFLYGAHRLLGPGGQILVDSADLRPRREAARRVPGYPRRADGRYIGEAQIQLEYRGEKGEPFPELYVDPDTLAHYAERNGWESEVVFRGEAGGYLARLTERL